MSGGTVNHREDFRTPVFRLIFELATTSIELCYVIFTPQFSVLFVWDIKIPKFSSCNVINTGRLKEEDEMDRLLENMVCVKRAGNVPIT